MRARDEPDTPGGVRGMKSRTAKDVRNFGAWRACTACSNAYAYLISLGSLQALPIKDTPIGSSPRVAGRDGDVREAGNRRRRGVGVQEVISIDEVDRPRRLPGWREDRVEVVRLHHRENPLAS